MKPDATPYHGKAYQVPHVHEAVLKKELDRLVKIGIDKSKGSPWASPNLHHTQEKYDSIPYCLATS